MNILKPVLKKRQLTATELTGEARSQMLKSFQSGAGWHRAEAVDQLSEEEAGIIASRLVERVKVKVPLTEDKAETLRTKLAAMFKENFIGSSKAPRPNAEQERASLLEGAARYLSEAELGALREAVASGLRPLPGEK